MRLKITGILFYLISAHIWSSDYFLLINLERQGLRHEAIAHAQAIDHPDIDLQILLARLYSQDDQLFKAKNLLNHILSVYPTDLDAYFLLISVLLKQGLYSQALAWTEIALLFHPFEMSLYAKKWQLHDLLYPSKVADKKSLKYLGKLSDYPVSQAIKLANNYLKVHPKDVDVALELGQVYFKHHMYQASIKILMPYLKLYPDYTDLRLVLINAMIQLKKYKIARHLCHQGLIRQPKQASLLKKQKDLNDLMRVKPVHTSPMPEKKLLLNELGVFDQLYYITDRRQLWDYTTFFYGRQTELGKIYGKINYANRLKREANQYEFEFFPKLGQYLYLDLDASVANQPILFPRYSYAGEAFVVLPKLFNFSIGDQFNRITDNLQFSRFTASISKEILKDWTTTFRSYLYFPGSGQNSVFYTLNIRNMLLEPYLYWGFVVGSGTTPDLANLETVNFLVLKNKVMFSPYLNFSLLQDRLVFNFSFLYQNQEFPNQRQREWIGSTMGVTWRF